MTVWAILAIAAIVNSALYLSAVVAVSIVENNWAGSRLGIVAMGVTFCSYLVQMFPQLPRLASAIVMTMSIALGIAAGICLL